MLDIGIRGRRNAQRQKGNGIFKRFETSRDQRIHYRLAFSSLHKFVMLSWGSIRRDEEIYHYAEDVEVFVAEPPLNQG